MSRHLVALLSGVALVSIPLAARAEDDIEGSKDHPAVKRFPGSYIMQFTEKEFQAAEIPVSETKTEHAEGKYYYAVYVYPAKTSCTQINRNYETALKAAGLKIVTGKQLPENASLEAINGSGMDLWATGIGKGANGGQVYIVVGCVESALDTPAGCLLVVETKPLVIEVTVEAMAKEIEQSGHVSLYGITFATGKADITPDSAKELAEVGKLLASKPEWKLRIEGHTDNVGKAKANLELSGKRAKAVKDWLVAKHGVDGARLTTQGFGDTKPVADNQTVAGKAKNRRVELVKL